MTELPTWAVYFVAIGTPLFALAGVLISAAVTYRWHRKDGFRQHLRWACDLATSDSERQRQLGVSQLRALMKSDMCRKADKELIVAAISELTESAAIQLEAPESGTLKAILVDVLELRDTDSESGGDENDDDPATSGEPAP